MTTDQFEDCTEQWVLDLRFELQHEREKQKTIERFMEYCCWLFETRKHQPLPPNVAGLLNQIFHEYFALKEKGRGKGALEKAFGFKGKQGQRKDHEKERRNEDIATDVARRYLQRSSVKTGKLEGAIENVAQDWSLSTSTIEKAWERHSMDGIIRYRLELQGQNKDFTPGQLEKAKKIVDEVNRKIQAHIGLVPPLN